MLVQDQAALYLDIVSFALRCRRCQNRKHIGSIAWSLSSLGSANSGAVPVEIGRSRILRIDTPGSDDSVPIDSEILTGILKLLAACYQGVSLEGVIYLHRITDIRCAGSQVKTLNIFKRKFGDLALELSLLCLVDSTRWIRHEVQVATGTSERKSRPTWLTMVRL